MKLKITAYLLFLSLGLVFIPTMQLHAQENYEIRKVVFKGNKTLDKDFLLENMALKEVSYLEKLVTKSVPSLYSEDLIDADLQRLKSIYQREGFLDVAVKAGVPQINEKKQTVKLVFEVEENDPVLVDSLRVQMTTDSVDVNLDSLRHKVFRKLMLTKKKRFRDEALLADVQTIEDAFRNQGYAYVKVDYKLSLKPEQSSTGIEYVVDPGPICVVGETRIEGNKHVSEKFIRKQISYTEGEKYNKSLLEETRKNLYQLQLFRVVSVLPESDAATRRSPIPVRIYMEEAPRLTSKFGAGYGTEDKFRTFLDFNYRGFWGGARRLNLYLKHSALEPYSVNLRWIQPQFLGKKSSIIINPFIGRNSEPGYETSTYGVNVPVTYRFTDQFNVTASYYLERVKQIVGTGEGEIPGMEDNNFLYNKSGVLVSAVFNDSKPKFSPEKGVNLSAGYKINGHLFGSDFNYSRLWGDFRTYHDLGDVILAFRIMLGGIHSADTDQFIPVEDRFYSGGSNSIRGWNRSELGPKRENGTPSGGKSVMESSLEARYPLFWKVSGVAFVDAGNVWPDSYHFDLGDLAYAVGGGIRVETPIGPVRFDIGFPVWNEKRSPQFFISVGQAF